MEMESRFLLDRELFEDLKSYLEDKRIALRDALLISISMARRGSPPTLARPYERNETLLSALSDFDDQYASLSREDLSKIDSELIVERLSNILWNYVEILEGMCRELFDQLKGVPVDNWDQDLYDRLEATQVYLWDKLKEIDEFIKHLEKSLEKFSLMSLKTRSFTFLQRLRVKIHKVLDPDLEKRIHKAEVLLHEEFKKFSQAYVFIKKAESRVETESYKFNGYPILNSLEIESQRVYRRLWRLLKLSETANRGQNYLAESINYTLRHKSPVGKTTVVLKEYLANIKDSLFDLAKSYRLSKDINAQAVICLWRAELNTLQKTTLQYRNYLLKTSPKPSLWSRLVKKEEARRTKELLLLKKEGDRLDELLAEIFDAQELGSEDDLHLEVAHFRRAERLLHDMGQPLISRSMMKSKTQELVNELLKSRELVSPLPEVSHLMRETLLKALRIDSKHETLTEAHGFWRLWEVHHALAQPVKSPQHVKRVKLYKKVKQHLKHWLSDHQMTRHLVEAEHEIHDIQETLQEFYHSLKGDLTYDEVVELKKEILEERVLFSAFFLYLRQQNGEGKQLRAEFAFVDKYFDAIEQRLSLVHPPEYAQVEEEESSPFIPDEKAPFQPDNNDDEPKDWERNPDDEPKSF